MDSPFVSLFYVFFSVFFYIFFGSATYTKMPKGFLGNNRKPVITILSVAVPLFLASLVAFTWLRKKRKQKGKKIASTDFSLEGNELKDGSGHSDLLIFDLSCIVAATDNFSLANKLGQGGFGSVFKVQLKFIMTPPPPPPFSLP